MITKTSTGGHFYLDMQGDPDPGSLGYDIVYKATNIGAHLSTSKGLTRYQIRVYYSTDIFEQSYYSDPSGVLDVNLRHMFLDLAGTGATSCYLRITAHFLSDDSTDQMLVALAMRPGIGYSNIWAPYGRGCSWLLTEAEDPHQVTPPNVIWQDTAANLPLLIENTVQTDVVWRGFVPPSSTPLLNINDNTMEIPAGATYFYAIRDAKDYKWRLNIKGACDTLVFLLWISSNGCKKAAYFPVCGRITDIGTLDLDITGNGYSAKKNRSEAYRCRLDGLSTYSLWYYSDILTSPVVYGSLDYLHLGSLSSPLEQIKVMGDTHEIREGHSLHSFEFIVKLAHYDQF